MTYDQFVEVFGIFASFIILVSLLMSSVKRLRLVNLFGSIFMLVYGIMISALPVVIMNVGIMIINLYYLKEMIKVQDYFKVLPVAKEDEYLKNFINYYEEDIIKAIEKIPVEDNDYRYFILRDLVPAGLFMAKKKDAKTLTITLDFVTPKYKDFKTGNYVFTQMAHTFRDAGFTLFETTTKDKQHMQYLKRMNFTEFKEENGRVTFQKPV